MDAHRGRPDHCLPLGPQDVPHGAPGVRPPRPAQKGRSSGEAKPRPGDLPQGDGHVVRLSPGTALVIDAGPHPEKIDGCLSRLGITRIPLLILTHLHADHVEGVPGLLHGRRVGEVEIGPLATCGRTRAVAALARRPSGAGRARRHRREAAGGRGRVGGPGRDGPARHRQRPQQQLDRAPADPAGSPGADGRRPRERSPARAARPRGRPAGGRPQGPAPRQPQAGPGI